jgi:ribosomal protein L37E
MCGVVDVENGESELRCSRCGRKIKNFVIIEGEIYGVGCARKVREELRKEKERRQRKLDDFFGVRG